MKWVFVTKIKTRNNLKRIMSKTFCENKEFKSFVSKLMCLVDILNNKKNTKNDKIVLLETFYREIDLKIERIYKISKNIGKNVSVNKFIITSYNKGNEFLHELKNEKTNTNILHLLTFQTPIFTA